MSSSRSFRILAQPLIAGAILFGAGAAAFSPPPAMEQPGIGGVTVIAKTPGPVHAVAPAEAPQPTKAAFARAPSMEAVDDAQLRLVAETFVWGLSNSRADVVWKYATEEEQAGLQTEPDVLRAFQAAYPPLAHAREITYQGMKVQGDMPFVSFYVKDKLGLQWKATFGLLHDDAGDWRVASLDITGAPGDLV